MDHRWRERISVDIRVWFRSQTGAIAAGRLADISASGAFIRTERVLVPLSRIDVLINGYAVPAYSGAQSRRWCRRGVV